MTATIDTEKLVAIANAAFLDVVLTQKVYEHQGAEVWLEEEFEAQSMACEEAHERLREAVFAYFGVENA